MVALRNELSPSRLAALNRDFVLLNSPSGERRKLNNTVNSSPLILFHVAKIKRFFGTCKDFPYFFSYFSKKATDASRTSGRNIQTLKQKPIPALDMKTYYNQY